MIATNAPRLYIFI